MSLELGRVNVFIGENGAGKSNILEAVALAGAASADKLDSEFLTARGIRVTQPEFMRSAFNRDKGSLPIHIEITTTNGNKKEITLENDNKPYSQWKEAKPIDDTRRFLATFSEIKIGGILNDTLENLNKKIEQLKIRKNELQKYYKTRKSQITLIAQKNELREIDVAINKLIVERGTIEESGPLMLEELQKSLDKMKSHIMRQRDLPPGLDKNEIKKLGNFIIYAPENSALRIFEREGQIEPLGVNGEGLLRLLAVLSESTDSTPMSTIKNNLSLLSWFKNFEVIKNDGNKRRIELEDNFIDDGYKYFDQKSSNEGFLFLLFYFSLFSTKLTPDFFAIDNIDVSLNPKLCKRLIELLVGLSKTYDKQVLLTTHNPAILDGLDLNDPDQGLFVVSRNANGYTKVKKTTKPQINNEAPAMKLSEMFYRGMIGGLPKGF